MLRGASHGSLVSEILSADNRRFGYIQCKERKHQNALLESNQARAEEAQKIWVEHGKFPWEVPGHAKDYLKQVKRGNRLADWEDLMLSFPNEWET